MIKENTVSARSCFFFFSKYKSYAAVKVGEIIIFPFLFLLRCYCKCKFWNEKFALRVGSRTRGVSEGFSKPDLHSEYGVSLCMYISRENSDSFRKSRSGRHSLKGTSLRSRSRSTAGMSRIRSRPRTCSRRQKLR